MSIGSSHNLSPLADQFVRFHISDIDKTKKPSITEKKEENASIETINPSFSTVETPTVSKVVGTVKKILVVQNAHQDDIHGMIPVGPRTFVSGSKDGSLKLWNTSGELVRYVWNPSTINYKKWITALTPFGSSYWMSGTRNGEIDIWKNTGEHIKSLQKALPPLPGIKCKTRNMERINCLSQDLTAERTGQYYVGVATGFSLHQADQINPLDQCRTSQNDWVYCIRPLAEKKVMVVTGPYLDIYTYDQKSDRWMAQELLGEARTRPAKNGVRPFISDVTFLAGQSNLCALSIFGGAVDVLDISTKNLVRTYKEHEKRVWQVVNICQNVVGSGSDDKTIRIWDIRCSKSVVTVKDHIGRVSTLLCYDNLLISGSCPDDLKNACERARLEYSDIRMLQSGL